MPRSLRTACACAAAAVAACSSNNSSASPLEPSAGNRALVLLGTGVQIYGCAQQASGAYAWQFKAPEAVLTDAAGRRAGDHFAGPTWRGLDGSTVVGQALDATPAPQPGAIPWLALRAVSHTGSGTFANVAYIVRSLTTGGIAPTTGCDAARVGTEARVDYTATYTFYALTTP